MGATLMAKKGGAEKPSPEPAGDQPQTTLKVLVVDQKLVAKVAAMRDQSIRELFESEDVRDFWRHLLLEQMQKERDQIGRAKRTP